MIFPATLSIVTCSPSAASAPRPSGSGARRPVSRWRSGRSWAGPPRAAAGRRPSSLKLPIAVGAIGLVALGRAGIGRPAAAAPRPRRPRALDARRRHARLRDHRGPRGLGWRQTVAVFAVAAPVGRLRRLGAARRASDARRALVPQPALHRRLAVGHVRFFALFGFIFLITQYFQFLRATSRSRPGCACCRSRLDRHRPVSARSSRCGRDTRWSSPPDCVAADRSPGPRRTATDTLPRDRRRR